MSSPTPRPDLTRLLTADAGDFTWAAAAIGSNNAAGYQLASGMPVMAIGGFNGTDPSPTLEQFIRYVDEGKIHYFVQGRMMLGPWSSGHKGESSAITKWVEARYPARTVEGAVVYDLTRPGAVSQRAHSSGPR